MGEGLGVGEGLGEGALLPPPSPPPALTMETAVTRPYRSSATKAFCGEGEAATSARDVTALALPGRA